MFYLCEIKKWFTFAKEKQRPAFMQGIGRLRAAFFVGYGKGKKSNFLY